LGKVIELRDHKGGRLAGKACGVIFSGGLRDLAKACEGLLVKVVALPAMEEERGDAQGRM
jgi:hypothetical protein